MNIAAIDDDKLFLNKLLHIIDKIRTEKGFQVYADSYLNGKAFLEHINDYDLVLLDIEMPEIDGLKLCSLINEKRNGDYPYVIFITSRDNLVFDALKLIPYSFIRKCDIDYDLEPKILSLYNRINTAKTVYTIKSGYESFNIAITDIIFIEKSKNYVIFHTLEDQYKQRSKISAVEKDFLPLGFVKINVGCIVNMRHITKVAAQTVEMTDGTHLSVSKPYRDDVRKKFSSFWS